MVVPRSGGEAWMCGIRTSRLGGFRYLTLLISNYFGG
jgi:hypothetical protein